jgi:hypothetical protein
MAARLLVRLLAHLRDDLLAQLRGWRDGGRARLARRWAARPPKRQLGARGLVVALVVLGLASLDARHRLAERLPSAVDWRALTALLERDARPGDLVVISPPWLERARLAVPARLPVLATGALDAEWLPGVRRAWLVAASGVTLAPSRPPLGERAAGSDTQQVGRLRITRLDLAAPVVPLASLAEQSGVATRWREVQGVARSCLTLVVRPGETARLPSPLPLVQLGGALAGHVAALPPLPSSPVRVLFRLDGRPPIPVDVPPRGGWQPFRIDTTELAGTPHLVGVEAEAPGGAVLCLEALVLP